jgi:hypothetical protein
MSNLPVTFAKTDIIRNTSLHLSYSFDKILSIEPSIGEMPFEQNYKIKALNINLEGRTSNPNISVSIDSHTTLFTLNMCYVTNIYPHEIEDTIHSAFVIEGYSVEHVNKERVMIYLPMNELVDVNNKFYPLEQAIILNAPNTKIENGLDLNEFIPSTSVDTDCYTYYKHSDNNGTIFHIIYFKQSSLGYTNALNVPVNSDYKSGAKVINSKSSTVAKQHSSMTNDFEDDIYIDCVPVDLLEQNKSKYLKIDKNHTKKFKSLLQYIAYFIILTLIVYGIYYLYIYASGIKLSDIKNSISEIKGSLSLK